MQNLKNTMLYVFPMVGFVLSAVLSLSLFFRASDSREHIENALLELNDNQRLVALNIKVQQFLSLVASSHALENEDLLQRAEVQINDIGQMIEQDGYEMFTPSFNSLQSDFENYVNEGLPDQKLYVVVGKVQSLVKVIASEQRGVAETFNASMQTYLESQVGVQEVVRWSFLMLSLVLVLSTWLIRQHFASLNVIRQNEKLYRLLFGSLTEGVLLLDRHGIIMRANPSASQLLKKSKRELRGLPLELAFPTIVSEPGMTNPLSQLHQVDKSIYAMTLEFSQPGDQVRWMSINSRPFQYDEDHQVESTLVSFVEITEKVIQDRTIEQQKQQMALSSRLSALGEMAGGIAHEINNPLAIINLAASTIGHETSKDSELDKDQVSTLTDKIQKTVTRISKIVKGLKKFARDGTNDSMEPVIINELVDEVVDVCSSKLRQYQVELRIQSFSNTLMAKCIPVQVSQVLLNLITNSAQAVEALDEKWIDVKIEEIENDFIQVSVTDSGSGIPKEVEEKMFHPFFTTKAVGVGTGLGMSISKGIIDDHGGRIYVDRDCSNTRITFTIPKYSADSDGASDASDGNEHSAA